MLSVDTVFVDLLRRFLNVYYLKPFDAVNDAATAWSLLQLPWVEPICEVGCGDGIFSFIMHGGELSLTDDRYAQCDPDAAGDIYNHYDETNAAAPLHPADRRYALGIDGNPWHLRKCRDWGLYDNVMQAAAESYPEVGTGEFATVFVYVYHGLQDYAAALREARRVLRDDGSILLLAYADTVRDNFACHNLSQRYPAHASYFAALDNGRRRELTTYSRPVADWYRLFERLDLRCEQTLTAVSPMAWQFYDVQTRPFLKALIGMDHSLAAKGLKSTFKAELMAALLPELNAFAERFAMPRRLHADDSSTDVFLAFHLRPRI